jgi:hypothetical protein
MASARTLITLVVGAVIAVAVLNPLITTANDNTGSQDVVNESVTASVGEYVELQGYAVDSGSETVYGFNDSEGDYEVASSPGDYRMNYSAGEIWVNSSSTLIEDGEEMKVSYTYQASGSTTETVVTLAPLLVALIVLVAFTDQIQEML